MNIKEIAKKAGVSVATVSRVLNHPENVAEETKNRIRSVMEESDYTPNWFARGLNMKKTNTLGLIIPDMLNPEYMEIAKAWKMWHTRKTVQYLCAIAKTT